MAGVIAKLALAGLAILTIVGLQVGMQGRANCAGRVGPAAELNNCDPSGQDLHGADLSHASLVYANLSGSNLQRANLAGADLTWNPSTPARPCWIHRSMARGPHAPKRYSGTGATTRTMCR